MRKLIIVCLVILIIISGVQMVQARHVALCEASGDYSHDEEYATWECNCGVWYDDGTETWIAYCDVN